MKVMITVLALAGAIASSSSVLAKQPTDTGAASKASSSQVAPKVFASPQKEGTRATCPVTGEEFTIAKGTLHAEHKGKHVYFCCPGCKKDFDKDPDKYTK